MSDVEGELGFTDALARIGELADDLVNHPDPAVAERVEELLDWIDAFHRDGLGRLVEMIRSWRGEIFLESVSQDDITGTLLRAYGLGEDDATSTVAAEAVTAALEEIRPYAESHGGSIVLDSISDGVVRVQMLGSCDGCPSSAVTLTSGVEEALRRHWPPFRRLELLDPAGPEAGALPEPAEPLLQIRGHEAR